MPCMDGREVEDRETNRIANRIACEYLTMLDKSGVLIPEYAREWWERHKEQDRWYSR